jgi:hypothetical protein
LTYSFPSIIRRIPGRTISDRPAEKPSFRYYSLEHNIMTIPDGEAGESPVPVSGKIQLGGVTDGIPGANRRP